MDPLVLHLHLLLLMLLLPLLFVALAQVAAPLVFSNLGGLETAQLTRTFQWFGGIVIAVGVLYAIRRLIAFSGWAQLRMMVAAAAFLGLSFITDIGVFVTHTDHDVLLLWSTNDRWEDASWCIITSETSLAHTGTVIND